MTGQAHKSAQEHHTGLANWAQAMLARHATRSEGKAAPPVPVPTHPRLDHLAEVLGLTPDAAALLALLYGLWLSPGSPTSVSAVLAAEVLGSGRGRARGHLAGWDLVREVVVSASGPVALVLDETIGDWLEGGDPIPPLLRERITLRRPLDAPPGWPVEDTAEFVRQLAGQDGAAVVVEIEGPAGSGRRSFATALGATLGGPPMIVDLGGLSASEAAGVARLAERAALLSMRPVAWKGAEDLTVPEGRAAFPIQMEILDPGSPPTRRRACARRRVILGPLDRDDRMALWSRLLPPGWARRDLQELADRKPATVGEIARVAAHAPMTVHEALAVIRADQRTRLDLSIRPQDNDLGWGDLVLPDRIMAALHRLHREIGMSAALWQQPGLSRLFTQGRGVFALFSGASGTGKTMAAQVIARTLGVDLYVVDSGAITSKYVGESAQNLQRVLAQAESDAALLFFDECDGLFGKRTDTRDAHDRYLNSDTNVLLKAVEGFRGACILATNRRDNIDSAFLRRLRYVVEFQRPDSQMRLALWKTILTAAGDADQAKRLMPVCRSLSEALEFTGAQIRNAVLTALIEARAAGRGEILPEDVLIGADHELMKEGRALSAAEAKRLRANV